MAKEQDQTQEKQEQEDTKSEADLATEKEDQEASAKAVKTSEDFDKKLDDEDVEDKTPSSEKEETTETDETKTEGDDKDAAKEKVEDDKVAAEKVDDAVKDEKVESKISDEVSKRTIELGLTEEEIAEFETDSDLNKTLEVIDSIIESTERQENVAQEPAPKKSQDTKGKTEDDGSGFKLTFKNEDEIDPELLTNIKGMQKHYEDQIKELRNNVNSLTDNFKAEETRRAIGHFDELIEKLGDEFTDTFGKGPSSELSRRGLANKNRTAVRNRMYAFAQGLNDARQNVPEIQQLFDITVRSLFGKKMSNVEGLRMHKKTTARSKGGKIGRSAARQTGTLTPQQKAVETSRKFDDLIDTAED